MVKSEIACPYDNNSCVEKRERLNNYANSVAYYAKHKINELIITNENMFDNCPRTDDEREKCKRYQEYISAQRQLAKQPNQK